MAVHVQIYDDATDTRTNRELDGEDFLVICAGGLQLTHKTRYASGTINLTLKPTSDDGRDVAAVDG